MAEQFFYESHLYRFISLDITIITNAGWLVKWDINII